MKNKMTSNWNKTRNLKTNQSESYNRKFRYAVVGLGYIAQSAILPSFRNISERCSLEALISDDHEKLKSLGKRYGVKNLYDYDHYEECLERGIVDAVYLSVPNSLHHEFAIRAANCGVNVLCEKPMAITPMECIEMINACKNNNVKLMIAYRLHFESANIEIISAVRSGVIGEPVYFSSVFSMQVKKDDIRTSYDLGGGTLFDIGIYCINAARNIFGKEPRRVSGVISHPNDKRFTEVDGLSSAILEFDYGKIATFVASFAASDRSRLEIVGAKGSIELENAFDHSNDKKYTLTINGKSETRKFKKNDQFAPELLRFAEQAQKRGLAEPSGYEGLADVRTIQAIYKSASTGRAIDMAPYEKNTRPKKEDVLKFPIVRKDIPLINAHVPFKE